MIRILDAYIGRMLLTTIFLVLSVLGGLSGLINFVDQLKKVGRGSYGLVEAALYVLFSLPRDLETFFPIAALLGALIGLGILASNSELVVMQASGWSKLSISGAVLKTAVPLILMAMALGEWVAPAAEHAAKQLRSEAISGGELISSERGTWVKDGQDFVYIGKVLTETALADVTVYRFNPDQSLKQVLFFARAQYQQDDQWAVQGQSQIDFSEQSLSQQRQANGSWASSLSPDKLSVVSVDPEALSIRGLVNYISYLQNSSQDAERYWLAFWRKVFQPLSTAVTMLLALSFVFGPLRTVTMGARILMGTISGFGIYFANELFGPMTLVYHLPPVLGAIMPVVLFGGLAVYLLRRS